MVHGNANILVTELDVEETFGLRASGSATIELANLEVLVGTPDMKVNAFENLLVQLPPRNDFKRVFIL